MATDAEMLAAYQAAEQAVLAGKTYQIAGRLVTRENLSEIRKGRQEYERRVATAAVTSKPGVSVATWNPQDVSLQTRDSFNRNIR